MPKQSLSTLFGWFIRGLKPTANQFRDVFLSFWHKDEKLPMSAIDQLPETLNDLSQNGLPTVWGNLDGAIEDQEDLAEALAGKASLGEDGKVLPEQLPAGLGGGGAWGDIDGDIQEQADLMNRLNKKADLDPEGKIFPNQMPITTPKADLGEDGKVLPEQLPSAEITELSVGAGLSVGQTEINIPGSYGRKLVVFRSDVYQRYTAGQVIHDGEDLKLNPALAELETLLIIMI